jgi:hypothetical protein
MVSLVNDADEYEFQLLSCCDVLFGCDARMSDYFSVFCFV